MANIANSKMMPKQQEEKEYATRSSKEKHEESGENDLQIDTRKKKIARRRTPPKSQKEVEGST